MSEKTTVQTDKTTRNSLARVKYQLGADTYDGALLQLVETYDTLAQETGERDPQVAIDRLQENEDDE